MSLHFQLISSNGVKFDDDAYEVLAPTKDGRVAIFEDHMPLLSAGEPGILSVRKKASDTGSQMEHFAVNGGILQVDGKSARFVTDDVTTADEINEQEARESLARAQKLIETVGTRTALDEARNVLRHNEARLHLSRLKRRHHR